MSRVSWASWARRYSTGREALGVAGDGLVPEGEREPVVEQLQRFEQEVVGRGGGDRAPVAFDEAQVVADGGVGEVEVLGDPAQGEALLAEEVDAEGASASLRRDVHGRAFLRTLMFCVNITNVGSQVNRYSVLCIVVDGGTLTLTLSQRERGSEGKGRDSRGERGNDGSGERD